MKKNSVIGLILIACILTITLVILNVYAIFESKVHGKIEVQNAKWIIHINNTDITTGTNKEFIIDKFNIENNNRTQEGKIAPGLGGNFNIVIDPKETDVSVRYDITFDLSELEGTGIQINSITETEVGNSFIRTDENTYTGIINLNDIKRGIIHNINVDFNWEENDKTNEKDTMLGSIPNNKILIPVSVNVSQYIGEEIKEYMQ